MAEAPSVSVGEILSPEAPAINDAPALRRAVAALWRRKWLIAGITLLGTASVVALGRATPPTYTATALLLVEPREAPIVGEAAVAGLSTDLVDIETVEKLLTSSATLLRVAEELHRRGTAGAVLALESGPPAPVQLAGAEPSTVRDDEAARVVALLRQDLAVARQGRSQVIAVSFGSPDPASSATVANTVAEMFLAEEANRKREAIGRVLGQLEFRLRELETDVMRADLAVQQFRKTHGFATDPTGDFGLRRVADLRQALDEAETDLRAKVAQRDYLRDAEDSGPSAERANAAASDPGMLLQAESERVQTAERVMGLRDAFSAAERENAEAQVARVELEFLIREAWAARRIYEVVLLRAQEVREQEGAIAADAELVSAANPPVSPSSAGLGLIAVMGLVAFGFLGAIVALAADQVVGEGPPGPRLPQG